MQSWQGVALTGESSSELFCLFSTLSPAAYMARVHAAADDFLHARKAGLGKQPRSISLSVTKGDGADPLLEFGEMLRVGAQGADADGEKEGEQVRIVSHFSADADLLAGPPGGVGQAFE